MQTARPCQSRNEHARCSGIEIRTGKPAISLPGIGFDLLLSEVAELNAVCAVDLLGDNGDLLFDGEV
jgi:hypothetical protein